MKRVEAKPDEAEAIKEAVRSFFEELLLKNEIALGVADPELDSERKPLRQIIIHHSRHVPGYYTLARLNVVHLLNLYMPYYCNPGLPNEQYLKGRAISSNHYRNGKMVFYAYHWWVEAGGATTRLLPDSAIGWQAGNWPVNCSSVAICINDDLTHKKPSNAAVQSVRNIIREHYGNIPQLELLGHREVNPKTECPGKLFLNGWQAELG